MSLWASRHGSSARRFGASRVYALLVRAVESVVGEAWWVPISRRQGCGAPIPKIARTACDWRIGRVQSIAP